jgi:predicted dehydrogenase
MDRVKRFLVAGSLRHHTPLSPGSPVASDGQSPFKLPPPRPKFSANPPRILIIGAGSRGGSYARAIISASNGYVAAVAEPLEFKRRQFGRKYIWGVEEPEEGMEFEGWEHFIKWETERRNRKNRGEHVPKGVDGVMVCTLDETHVEIITRLAPLNLHILSEKPLATTLDDCLRIYTSLSPAPASSPAALFAVGHVLRYSPYNILLRKLLREDNVIGEIISVEHTEPIGWWHFAHSYVR